MLEKLKRALNPPAIPGHKAKVGLKVKKLKLMVRKADGRLITPEQNQTEYKEGNTTHG